uniref:Odorant receptor n=1 Tax=Heortia vitessoides TaxID=1557813 RepID=A0A978W728_9NEOP|nr:odorant receptor 31 [Heortia vitessoides]
MEHFGKYLPHDSGAREFKFESFEKSYKYCMFSISLSMMYPNPSHDMQRILSLPCAILLASPVYAGTVIHMYKSWLIRDLNTLFSLAVILGPITAYFIKMVVMFVQSDLVIQMLEEVNKDYATCNRLPLPYKLITHKWVTLFRNFDRTWSKFIFCMTFSFPILTALRTAYSYLFHDEPTRYTIIDTNLPFRLDEPELKLQTPYYEISFAFLTLYTFIYFYCNVTGFDSMKCLFAGHVCLKLELCSQAMVDALKIQDIEERYLQVTNVIKEQNKVYAFVETYNKIYQTWLTALSVYLVAHLCTSAVHLSSKFLADIQYISSIVASTYYCYMLCAHIGRMTESSSNMALALYCSGWENVRDLRIRRMIAFAIARTQLPLRVIIFSNYPFDIQLFVSIVKTAYSLFTLLNQSN